MVQFYGAQVFSSENAKIMFHIYADADFVCFGVRVCECTENLIACNQICVYVKLKTPAKNFLHKIE